MRTTRRWLVPTAQFFLGVQAPYVPANDPGMVDLALNITYLGLALNEGGACLAVLTLWTMATNDMNRWLFRIVVILGWMLAISVPLVLNGWIMMLDRRGAGHSRLGMAADARRRTAVRSSSADARAIGSTVIGTWPGPSCIATSDAARFTANTPARSAASGHPSRHHEAGVS